MICWNFLLLCRLDDYEGNKVPNNAVTIYKICRIEQSSSVNTFKFPTLKRSFELMIY